MTTSLKCLALFLSVLAGGCAISTPRNTVEGVSGLAGDHVLIVTVTEAHHAGVGQNRTEFWQQTRSVARDLGQQAGLVQYSLRREIFGTRAWTMTVWKDEDSLNQFYWSPAHAEAMAQATAGLTGAKFARLYLRTDELASLSWSKALQALDNVELIKPRAPTD